MLDGIEQPGDRRLMEDIANTSEESAVTWRNGYDTGRNAGVRIGYIDAITDASRLIIDVGAATDNETIKLVCDRIAAMLLRHLGDNTKPKD